MNAAAIKSDPDPERRAESAGCVRSGFMAAVWWKLAPFPDGTCLVRGGGWCQGLGSFDLPWEGHPSRAACAEWLREAASAVLAATAGPSTASRRMFGETWPANSPKSGDLSSIEHT